ncbi:hypothetical protein Patl1_13665 [Pistacia atlantica]|uniref:Uncharacterized protein n=1 Tax=Pistacia atlantica TaxID=434234 RepID=A0ACC1AUG0_9ROSI|nr:hypothetical protein Patl1_13665 [Pistacia atlantica]
MGEHINDQGWLNARKLEFCQNVYYGGYKCMGPGADSIGQPKFVKILSDVEAKPFLSILTSMEASGFSHLPKCELIDK